MSETEWIINEAPEEKWSKAERTFIEQLRIKGEESKEWIFGNVRKFKHRNPKKRKLLTDDPLTIKAVLDQLQSIQLTVGTVPYGLAKHVNQKVRHKPSI